MEEDKKELVGDEAIHEKNKSCHFCNCPLSGHKAIRAVLLGLAIFIILSIGVGIRFHSNNYRENNYRSFGQNNIEQRGGRMMQGERFQGRNGGACPMMENNNNQVQGGACPMMENNNNQVQGGGCRMINQAEIQAVYPTPAKAATSTIVK